MSIAWRGRAVKLTDFYAAPQCTPTRTSLITGRYQQRVGLEGALNSSGPRDGGLVPDGSIVAPVAQEQRVRDRLDWEVASGLEARVEPE